MKKNNPVIWIVVLVILLGAGYAGYHLLAGQTEPGVRETEIAGETVRVDGDTVNAQAEETAEIQAAEETDAQSELAADFEVMDENGEMVHLTDMAGRPVIVNFWATWCPPCQGELPYFEEARKTYEGMIDFMMVDLTDGYRDTADSVRRFVEDGGYTFPVYFDITGSAVNAYGIYSIPMTIGVSAEGELVFLQVGAMSQEKLESLADKLLQ